MGRFRDFWPVDLGAHQGRWTRRIHFFGSLVGAVGDLHICALPAKVKQQGTAAQARLGSPGAVVSSDRAWTGPASSSARMP
jgi:hypothetical protein